MITSEHAPSVARDGAPHSTNTPTNTPTNAPTDTQRTLPPQTPKDAGDSKIFDKDAAAVVLHMLAVRLAPLFHEGGRVRKSEFDAVVEALTSELRLPPQNLASPSPRPAPQPPPPQSPPLQSPPLQSPALESSPSFPLERRRHHLGRLLTSIVLVRRGPQFFSATQPGAFRILANRLPAALRAAVADDATYEAMNDEAKAILTQTGVGSEEKIWATIHADHRLYGRAARLSAQTLSALAPQGRIAAVAVERIADQAFPLESLHVMLNCFLLETQGLTERFGREAAAEAFGPALLEDIAVIAQNLVGGASL